MLLKSTTLKVVRPRNKNEANPTSMVPFQKDQGREPWLRAQTSGVFSRGGRPSFTEKIQSSERESGKPVRKSQGNLPAAKAQSPKETTELR